MLGQEHEQNIQELKVNHPEYFLHQSKNEALINDVVSYFEAHQLYPKRILALGGGKALLEQALANKVNGFVVSVDIDNGLTHLDTKQIVHVTADMFTYLLQTSSEPFDLITLTAAEFLFDNIIQTADKDLLRKREVIVQKHLHEHVIVGGLVLSCFLGEDSVLSRAKRIRFYDSFEANVEYFNRYERSADTVKLWLKQ